MITAKNGTFRNAPLVLQIESLNRFLQDVECSRTHGKGAMDPLASLKRPLESCDVYSQSWTQRFFQYGLDTTMAGLIDNNPTGVDVLNQVGAEYQAKRVNDSTVHLESLRLFISIRQIQSMAMGSMAIFISEITASNRPGSRGITVTCVGQGETIPSAIADAIGQWAIGVLPVLAQWRGEHSCLPETQSIETRAGSFEILASPVLLRGAIGDHDPPFVHVNLIDNLKDLISPARPALQLHWLEMYACKFPNEEVDATCRLNNHDWPTATRTLASIAKKWPTVAAPILSQRQFALLRPQGVATQEIRLPTLWNRLTGRA